MTDIAARLIAFIQEKLGLESPLSACARPCGWHRVVGQGSRQGYSVDFFRVGW
jgi:hypothetical protein